MKSFRLFPCLVLSLSALSVTAAHPVGTAEGVRVCRPEARHAAALRRHTGIPSLAVSPSNGRLWVTFYGGEAPGEDSTSNVPLLTSADGGRTWQTVLVAEPIPGRRVFDPGLWVAPDGRLRWSLTSRACRPNVNDLPIPYAGDQGDPATDLLMMAELSAEDDPVSRPVFRPVAEGVMMNKPIVLRDGAWLLPVAHWYAAPSACFYRSTDGGRHFSLLGGVSSFPPENRLFDEQTVVELANGDLLSFIRAKGGRHPSCLESVSQDGGRTWSVAKKARFAHTSSRHALRRLKSGHLLLVKNGPFDKDVGRRELSAFLSCDEGKTWQGPLVLDEREEVSYPDIDQASDGLIHVVYDRKRLFAQEVLVAGFTEKDVLAGFLQTAESFLKRPVVSLAAEKAAVLNIDCGRQLFVDNALIATAHGLNRHWNHPVKEDDPVVWPSGGAGQGVRGGGTNANLTCATDGGLWWDPTRRRYRLWYQADWCGDICYAESEDGRRWTYPDLGIVKGTNRVFENDTIDSWCVVPNYAAANPYADWKMHISEPGGPTRDLLFRSEDGFRFQSLGCAGWSFDRSTMFYDPFRAEWVFSLRDGWPMRARRRFVSRTFGGVDCRWRWPGVKGEDASLPVPEKWMVVTNRPNWQLYSFNAVAYESVMLGVMEVLYNTPHDNADGEAVGLPKQTGLHFCFSRDGRTFVPREESDIAPCGWGSGKWDTGYLSAIGGICTVDDERLTFYYSGLRGDGTRLFRGPRVEDWSRNGMYSNGAIGRATLRRDGFAGLVADARGELVTRPIVFSGGHLFVNADCLFGSVRAEVLDRDGVPLKGWTAADCTEIAGTDTKKRELVFRGGDLSALGKRGVRLRFKLQCATLYLFWISPSAHGESRGYVAAGGPDYPGLRDVR